MVQNKQKTNKQTDKHLLKADPTLGKIIGMNGDDVSIGDWQLNCLLRN